MNHEIIDILSPYKLNDKIRVGCDYDGGYIVSERVTRNTKLIVGAGVDNNYDFEKRYHDLTRGDDGSAAEIVLYDYSVDVDVSGEEHTTFHKDYFDRQTMHMYRDANDAFLKMDIEGSEYEAFSFLPKNAVSFLGMAIEWHGLARPTNRPSFIDIHRRVLSNYMVFHVHGNNHSPTFPLEWNGTIYQIPNVVELSYIRKDLVTEAVERDRGPYPTELDAPNTPTIDEFKLEWIK